MPLEKVALSERTSPADWIAMDRYDVTDDFISYARPPIGNDWVSIPIINGIQRFALLKPLFAEKKLREYTLQGKPHPALDPVLNWTLAVNEDIAAWLRNTPPFPYIRKSIERLSRDADAIVVSQTPHGALIFPVVPGHENRSWKLFFEDALDKFLNGQYEGKYQAQLISEFEKSLPEKPAWK